MHLKLNKLFFLRHIVKVQAVPFKNRLHIQRYFKSSNYCTSYNDTIFALSSGHGKCGVAVIRVSGGETKSAVRRLCKLNNEVLPPPRVTLLKKFFDPETKHALDKGLVVWFPGPGSFTGEDSAEFHIHGGTAVIAAMTSALSKIPGLRYAQAGDFTKRAFINGKLDLTEVEGLGDLIHAETEAQRKQALRQMDGDLSKMYTSWRTKLIKLTADVEAYIDFGEDENIEEDTLEQVNTGIEQLLQGVKRHLADNRKGERLRDGVHVTIIGEPNVGKSSLLNAVCQRPAAIVSPTAGTTRDIVETPVNIGGYPILLSDTAGLRQTTDDIEKEGVRRAIVRAQQSDIKVLVMEPACVSLDMKASDVLPFVLHKLQVLGITDINENNGYLPEVKNEDINSNKTIGTDVNDIVFLINKSDLVTPDVHDHLQTLLQKSDLDYSVISCQTGEGIDDFVVKLKEKVEKICGNPLVGNPSLTQARHRSHLELCAEFLGAYQEYMEVTDVVMAAQYLRFALSEFGKISGKISSEDILDVIFRDFCIGK